MNSHIIQAVASFGDRCAHRGHILSPLLSIFTSDICLSGRSISQTYEIGDKLTPITEIENMEVRRLILTGHATASNGQNDLQDGFGQTPLHP